MSLRHIALTSLAFISFGTAFAAHAKPCRDAKGKFAKCEQIQKKPSPCRDEKGRFTSCNKKDTKSDMKNMKMPQPHADMKSDMNMPTPSPAKQTH